MIVKFVRNEMFYFWIFEVIIYLFFLSECYTRFYFNVDFNVFKG